MKTTNFLRIGFLIAIAVFSFSSCKKDGCKKCKGSDGISPIRLDKIDRVIVDFDGELRLFQDTFQFAAVAGKDAAISNINTEVENGTWTIRYNDCITCEENVIINLAVTDLKSIEILRNAKVIAAEAIKFPNFEIIHKGSGQVAFDIIQTPQIKVTNAGSGDLILKGAVDQLEATVTGSGVLRTFEMPAGNVDATNSGSGTLQVTALTQLNAIISGAGNIQYKGSPSITQNITGAGALINAN